MHPTDRPQPIEDADLMTGLESSALVALAEEAARAAGVLVHGGRPERLEVDTKSSPTDVVTQMDTTAEELLRKLVGRRRPEDGLLGEEAGLEAGTSGLTWVIDPIDGTVNYLYGLPTFAVSVAVVTGDPTTPGAWTPLAGCVHSPATGLTWTAVRGGGAYLNGRRLQLGAPPALESALVGTGFGYRAARRANQARVLAELLPQIRDIRRFGCASIDLCMVATGMLDAYYERGLNPWDLAAGVLVVTESGGAVRGLGELPPSDLMVVAGRDPLLADLAGLLLELDAGRED